MRLIKFNACLQKTHPPPLPCCLLFINAFLKGIYLELDWVARILPISYPEAEFSQVPKGIHCMLTSRKGDGLVLGIKCSTDTPILFYF